VRRLLFALVIAGGVLVFAGVQEYRLSKVAKAEPQTITCAQLASKGPGENAHVRLTEFEFTENYVYQEQKRSTEWKVSYVPAVPPRVKDDPGVRVIKVLIKSTAARNENELFALGQAPVQGVVINTISALGRDERRLLKESYPGVDFDTCWIVEAGKEPASRGRLMGLIGGGSGLAVVAAGLLLAAAKKA
jgi:hypothetical protein